MRCSLSGLNRSAGIVLSITALLLCWSVCVAAQAPGAAELNAEGVKQYEAKDFEGAIELFSKAYNLSPDAPAIRRNLCNAYQAYANELAKASDFESAVKLLSTAIGVEPQNPSPLVQLGSYLLRLDLVSEAIPRLEEALQLDAKNADAYFLLGEAYYRQNDLPAALAQWQFSLELNPNRPGLKERIEKAQRHDSVEANYRKSGSHNFDVSFAPNTRSSDLGRILQTLERARWELGRKLGGAYPPSPIQVIVYTDDDFQNATLLGKHVGGVYDGKIRLPIPGKQGATLSDAELQRVLYHEYVHCILRHIARDNVPWWLNEGLAETLSRPFTPEMAAALRQAQTNKQLQSIGALEDSQLDKLDPVRLERAYIQAHAAARWLWDRFGANVMVRFLGTLAAGTPAEDALTENYRRNYESLDLDVMGNLDRLVTSR